jgi:hypothetical protein
LLVGSSVITRLCGNRLLMNSNSKQQEALLINQLFARSSIIIIIIIIIIIRGYIVRLPPVSFLARTH